MRILNSQPVGTATRKTPICEHPKIPGIDAEFCRLCRLWYPAELLARARATKPAVAPKSPLPVDASPQPPPTAAPPPEPEKPYLETLPDEPKQPPPEISNPAWHLAKAQTYLKLMNQIAGSAHSPEVKRAEIARLQRLRDEALAKAKTEDLSHA